MAVDCHEMKIHLDPWGEDLRIEVDGKELPVMAIDIEARRGWATKITLEMVGTKAEIEGLPREVGNRTRG